MPCRERHSDGSRRGLGVLLFLLLVLGLLGCGTSGPPDADLGSRLDAETRLAHPPFVRVEGERGATLLVLGTIHLGPPEGWRFPPAIERALDEATGIVMEVDLTATTEAEIGTLVAELAVLPPGTWLDDVISPETVKVLEENETLLADFGLPARYRTRFEPWFLTVGLLEGIASQAGYTMERSVEQLVIDRRSGRGIVALETIDEQLRFFDDLPLPLQDLMLRDTVARLPEATSEIERLIQAWRRNDQRVLEEISRQGVEELPELESLYDVILDQRNRRWIDALEGLLEDPERAGEQILVAVGALHLVGDTGLPALFEAADHRVSWVH